MKYILVTGASGRVGKKLVKELRKKNKIIEFDRTHGYDILRKRDLMKFSKKVKMVYHLASLISYTASNEELYKVNVLGTKNVVDVFRGIPIIYMSSTAVYGNKISDIPADEKTETRPATFYGRSKLEAEKIVLNAGGISIRAPTIYGPGFEEGFFYVFEKIENGSMPIFGSGRNRIDLIHIDDLVSALILAGKYGRSGEVYNVSGPSVLTQEKLYKLVAESIGVKPPEKHIPVWLAKLFSNKKIKAYIDKLSSDRVFDIRKAKRELKWEPKVGYEEGIRQMVKLYKKFK